MMHYSPQSEPLHILLHILQDNDGFAAVPVFAHICTAPVFDDGGCTDIVFATGDCCATANLQNPDTAK